MIYTDEHWALAKRYPAMREQCPCTNHDPEDECEPCSLYEWHESVDNDDHCPNCETCKGEFYVPNITTDALIHVLLSEGYVWETGTDFYQLGTKGYWLQFTRDNSNDPTFYGTTHQEALIQAVLFDMAVDDEMEAKTNE